jgi:hypothetical protein
MDHLAESSAANGANILRCHTVRRESVDHRPVAREVAATVPQEV